MVTKKKPAAKVRTRTVYKARPKTRRAKSGYEKIAPAAATVALVAANAKNIKSLVGSVTNNGQAKMGEYPARFLTGFTGKGWVNESMKKFISADSLVKDAAAIAGGYIGGEIMRKYAPTIIKKPIAKIAKKIPKVI